GLVVGRDPRHTAQCPDPDRARLILRQVVDGVAGCHFVVDDQLPPGFAVEGADAAAAGRIIDFALRPDGQAGDRRCSHTFLTAVELNTAFDAWIKAADLRQVRPDPDCAIAAHIQPGDAAIGEIGLA